MAISTKFTHADLLVMPDDGKRREIVDGELFVTPSPLSKHQLIVSIIAPAFFLYLDDHPIGRLFMAPLDVIFGEYDVLEPDLLFILNEHRSIIQDWVRGAPDLVVEVLSPTTARQDPGPKLKAYARFSVPEYWIVDPDNRAVEVYRLAQAGYAEPQRFLEPDILVSRSFPVLPLPFGTSSNRSDSNHSDGRGGADMTCRGLVRSLHAVTHPQSQTSKTDVCATHVVTCERRKAGGLIQRYS